MAAMVSAQSLGAEALSMADQIEGKGDATGVFGAILWGGLSGTKR
jgi:hypothetical protein